MNEYYSDEEPSRSGQGRRRIVGHAHATSTATSVEFCIAVRPESEARMVGEIGRITLATVRDRPHEVPQVVLVLVRNRRDVGETDTGCRSLANVPMDGEFDD